jgi:hypothetical protein
MSVCKTTTRLFGLQIIFSPQLNVKSPALAALSGRGSIYLDESQGPKWSRDLQERSAPYFSH